MRNAHTPDLTITHLDMVASMNCKQTLVNLEQSRKNQILLLSAWSSIILLSLTYFVFYRGGEYVELHSGGLSLKSILLKFLYITYACILLLGYKNGKNEYIKSHCFLLTLAIILLFGFLYQLRSPIFFTILLYISIFNTIVNFKKIIIGAILIPIFFAIVALIRDPNLVQDGNLSLGILTMILTFGDFANTINFSMERISTIGVSYGIDILGSFSGLVEPLANKYARSISEEYFNYGGGFGFFFPSDLIANFGVYGSLIVSFLIGKIITKIRYKQSLTSFIITTSVFSSSLTIVRNDLGTSLRAVVYIYLATIFLKLFIGIDEKNQSFNNFQF